MHRQFRYLISGSLLLPLLVISLNLSAIAQSSFLSHQVRVNVEAGVSYQFFGLNNYLLSPKVSRLSNIFLSLNAANGIGFGVPVGISAYSPNSKWGLKFNAALRYDVIRPELGGRSGWHQAQYGLFADYHFSIFRNFAISFAIPAHNRGRAFKLDVKPGIGYSFLSVWQRNDYSWWDIDSQTGKVISGDGVDLSFSGISISLDLKPTNRLGTELKLIHVSQNQLLYKYYQSANLIVIKLYYQFPLTAGKLE